MQIHTLTKKELKKQLSSTHTITSYHQTAAGVLCIYATELGVFKAEFVQPDSDAKITPLNIDKILLAGTEFQIKVWKAALSIPAGKTASYKQLAIIIGHPKAHRAVANALKNNPIGYFVPCHRVLKSSGELCGYNGGVDKKRKLLEAEGAL